MLSGKKIILGVTGSIAAYKAATLIRLLVKENVLVKVIMTRCAKEFITPLTLATLSKNPILVEFYNPGNGDWNNHVELGLWADAFLVAPASANTIAKMAHGIADNLLLTTYLSARCPVFVAPAMDTDMFSHTVTQKNIALLKESGIHIIEPAVGELASGLSGKGRMEEPEKIFSILETIFNRKGPKKKLLEKLTGKRILVTAGPTYEAIDPVRFIGNHSSGKMGYAIAEELASNGCEVVLVSGPSSLGIAADSINLVRVDTADEMYDASMHYFPKCDGAILSAAVADYKPEKPATGKIKHSKGRLIIELVPTRDIAAELGKIKKARQVLAGFALETDREVQNAREKLRKKNFDFIVLNSLRQKGAGFKTDTNKVMIIDKNNKTQKFELKSKREVASDIVIKLAQTF